MKTVELGNGFILSFDMRIIGSESSLFKCSHAVDVQTSIIRRKVDIQFGGEMEEIREIVFTIPRVLHSRSNEIICLDCVMEKAK